MSLDIPLPKKVFGHPWFNFGADKMSKSKGNVIYADELAARFTVDGVRHYALSEMPYASDGSVSYENVILRYNNDLANNLGNLVSRTIAMNAKYFDSIIPTPGEETDLDRELKAEVMAAVRESYELMESYRIADASDRIFSMLRRTNKYIDETMPWALAKNEEDKPRLATVIYNLLEAIRVGAVLLTPFIPASAETILESLGTSARDYDSIQSFGALESGITTKSSGTLFSRIDEKKMFEELQAELEARMAAAKAKEKPEDCEEEIKIDDFMKVELRCAQILSAEKMKKAKKLLKLQVDLGYEKRQVLSGIAKDYEPEALIGKKVALVSNLAPATLCGELSEGMILATGSDKIRVVFLDDETPLGDRIR